MSEHNSGTGDFDEIDLALLEFVESDFDVSLDQLSDELNLSKSAIHYRLNNLKTENIIQGITADLNPESFGLNMVAITEISVTHEEGYSEDIGLELGSIDGIEQVYYTMGDTDFVVISRVQDRSQMNEVIDQIVAVEAVNETSSRFVMDEIKSSPTCVSIMSTEMKNNLIDDKS